MKADLVIGIDASTTATKAIAFDRQGRAVAESRVAVPLSQPRPGWFEQDVSDWTGSTAAALRQITRKVSARRVAAVAVSNQRESFAQFDERGKALGPGILWLDERARQEVQDLSALLGRDMIHRLSGKMPDLTPCLYSCLWLARHKPKLWRKTCKTAEVSGVLAHFLTGQWRTSVASADPMGLLDIQARDWSPRLLEAVKLTRGQVPDLVDCGDVIGETTEAAAKLTGLRVGTLLIAGGGDGQCAGTGANIFQKGRAYLNLGTASVSGRYGPAYAADAAFRTLIAVAERGYSFETAIRTGTFLLSWLVEEVFGEVPQRNPRIYEKLEAEASAGPIGSGGLALVPYWSGVMTPYWDTGARGVIAGLSGSHTRGDIYRAAMESLALEQTMMTNRVAAVTGAIDHYAIVGGGSKSDLWCQIFADASGRVVKRLETVEASALGAAMAAAKGAGWYASIVDAAAAMSGKTAKTFRPRMKAHARYADLLSVYVDLWPALAGWNKRMQEFAKGNA